MSHRINQSVRARKSNRFCKSCGHKIKRSPRGKPGHAPPPTPKKREGIKMLVTPGPCYCGCKTIT